MSVRLSSVASAVVEPQGQFSTPTATVTPNPTTFHPSPSHTHTHTHTSIHMLPAEKTATLLCFVFHPNGCRGQSHCFLPAQSSYSSVILDCLIPLPALQTNYSHSYLVQRKETTCGGFQLTLRIPSSGM
jgi:hypothetical protein